MGLSVLGVVRTYARPKTVARLLSSAEAGSGIVYVQLFSSGVNDAATDVRVKLVSDGTMRTITKQFYDVNTGLVKVTGTGFVAGDRVEVHGMKFI
jgi:hypothetical protein